MRLKSSKHGGKSSSTTRKLTGQTSGLSIAFLYFLHQRLKRNRQVEYLMTSTTSQAYQANEQDPPANSFQRQPNQSRYIKPALSLIAVVSAMAICILPYCFYVIVIELFCQRCNEQNCSTIFYFYSSAMHAWTRSFMV